MRLETWRALEELQRTGVVRSIGVSNYGIHHLQELLDNPQIAVKPAVNQIELSPFNARTALVSYCQQHDIVVQAYSPLTKGRRLNDRRLVALAARLGVTPAQLCIRWCVEKGAAVVPKSSTPGRIEENANVFNFTIDADTMRELDQLDDDFVAGWDPTTKP